MKSNIHWKFIVEMLTLSFVEHGSMAQLRLTHRDRKSVMLICEFNKTPFIEKLGLSRK